MSIRSKTVVLAMCAATAALAVPTVAKSIFLNGVNIDGVINQKFENATVVIDDKGNVLISVKGYEVQTVVPVKPVVADSGPVTKRYFMVNEASGPGLAQYDIDVFVNSVWIKRVSSNDTQNVLEITKYLKRGKNVIHFTAQKVLTETRKSASPNHYVKIYIGEGNMGGNQVMIDNNLLEYKRDASEMQTFADDYTVEGK